MTPCALICLGNRHLPGDDTGCRVFDYLAENRPHGIYEADGAGIEIIDGGLAGLDLLRLIEGRQRVVFVDAVAGVAPPGDIVVLRREEVAAFAAGGYGHGAGLPYLLHLLPLVCDAPLPEVALVGAEGRLDDPEVQTLAARGLEVALNGMD